MTYRCVALFLTSIVATVPLSLQILCSDQYRLFFMFWCSRYGAEIVAVFSHSPLLLLLIPLKRKIEQKLRFVIFQSEYLYGIIMYLVTRIR